MQGDTSTFHKRNKSSHIPFTSTYRKLKTHGSNFKTRMQLPIQAKRLKDTNFKQSAFLLQAANQSYEQGEYGFALYQFDEYLIYQGENDPKVLYLVAMCLMHLNAPQQAIQRLEYIPQSKRRSENILLLLSIAYEKIGDLQKAFDTISFCLDINPTLQEALCCRGRIYLKSKRYRNAQKDLKASLKINDNSFITKVALGDCFLEQNRHQQALQMFNQAISLAISQNEAESLHNAFLKKGMCAFELEKYAEVTSALQKVPQQIRNSDIFYYLGMGYFRLGEKKQGILNLEYCIRTQSNSYLMQKAFKTMIKHYLEEFQFYEAVNVIKMADIADIDSKYWKDLIEGCMLIIKSHYREGLLKIDLTNDIIKKKKGRPSSKTDFSNKNFYTLEQKEYQNEFIENPQKVGKATQHINKTPKKSFKRHYRSASKKIYPSCVVNPVNKNNSMSIDTQHHSLKHVHRKKFIADARTGAILRTVSMDKEEPSRRQPHSKRSNLSLNKRISGKLMFGDPKSIVKKVAQKVIFSEEEAIILTPIILKFKAYAEFFLENYLKSLDTLQQYEAYMWNVFGKDVSSNLLESKAICEGYLLSESQMYQEAISKFEKIVTNGGHSSHSNEVQNHSSDNSNEHILIQSLLCEMAILLKAVLPEFFSAQNVQEDSFGNFEKIVDLSTDHSLLLGSHHLSHYYLAIMHILSERYEDAQQQLQQTLKIAEECSWKFLFLKGIVELILGNFYTAIKEFTAGLILQQNSELYLGRSIAFILEGSRRKSKQTAITAKVLEKSIQIQSKRQKDYANKEFNDKQKMASSQIYTENSFEDLQKFIQLETNQEKISTWVSKLLFYNQAYAEARKALEKIENRSQELLQIEMWLLLYEGEFEECGQLGNLIMLALEGKLYSEEETSEQGVLNALDLQIAKVLQGFGTEDRYRNWLSVIHLCKVENYRLLMKLLQKMIFESPSQEQVLESRYNLGLVYLLLGDEKRALSIFTSLKQMSKKNEFLSSKLQKIIDFDFQEDECLPDLTDELSTEGTYRLSKFMPYVPVVFQGRKVRRVYFKFSIPFPDFPKPSLLLRINEQFLREQLSLNLIEKKIEAPWIKKTNQKIQFTEEIIEAHTDFLKETQELKQQSS